MKILATENTLNDIKLGANPEPVFYPDSSILRNNDDFYVPNFSSNINATIGVYIKLGKIGKCIETTFSHRYFSEYGVAINFYANDGKKDVERSFDKSFAASTILLDVNENPINYCEIKFSANGNSTSLHLDQTEETIHSILAEASKYFTIKIGDLLYIPMLKISETVTIGNNFSVEANGKNILHFNVK